jgi:translation elongation factor EF-1beta
MGFSEIAFGLEEIKLRIMFIYNTLPLETSLIKNVF